MAPPPASMVAPDHEQAALSAFAASAKNPTVSSPYQVGCPVVLDFQDLLSDKDLSDQIEEAFGNRPTSLGLVLIKNVPNFIQSRERLLRLSSRFANLPEDIKARYEHAESFYNIGWSHGKEIMNGQPDTAKGSYYANPLTDDPLDTYPASEVDAIRSKHPEYCHENIWPADDVLSGFDGAFKQLGSLICSVGVQVAKHCDKFITRHPSMRQNNDTLHPDGYVQRLVSESKTTKARLLHYFPLQKKNPLVDNDGTLIPSTSNEADMDSWCGWHLDHSMLTGLTSAMYIDERDPALPEIDPKDPTYSALFPNTGLYIKNRGGQLVKANIPRDHLAFQLGECLQLISNESLRATPHCVRGIENDHPLAKFVARNTFAVFMQPNLFELVDPPVGEGSSNGVGVKKRRNFVEFSADIFKEHY